MSDITKVFEEYAQALNSREYSRVSQYFHENISFCHTGEMKTSPEKIKAFHEHFWNTLIDSKWIVTDVEIIHSDSKCQIYSYQYNYTGYFKGEYVEGCGRTTDIFVKSDPTGQWKLLHAHSSTATPNHDD